MLWMQRANEWRLRLLTSMVIDICVCKALKQISNTDIEIKIHCLVYLFINADRHGFHYRSCLLYSIRLIGSQHCVSLFFLFFFRLCVCVSVRSNFHQIIKTYCNLSAGRWTTNLRKFFLSFFSHFSGFQIKNTEIFPFHAFNFPLHSRSGRNLPSDVCVYAFVCVWSFIISP